MTGRRWGNQVLTRALGPLCQLHQQKTGAGALEEAQTAAADTAKAVSLQSPSLLAHRILLPLSKSLHKHRFVFQAPGQSSLPALPLLLFLPRLLAGIQTERGFFCKMDFTHQSLNRQHFSFKTQSVTPFLYNWTALPYCTGFGKAKLTSSCKMLELTSSGVTQN